MGSYACIGSSDSSALPRIFAGLFSGSKDPLNMRISHSGPKVQYEWSGVP